MKLNISNFII